MGFWPDSHTSSEIIANCRVYTSNPFTSSHSTSWQTTFDINSACVKQPFIWRSCEHKSVVLDGTSTKRRICDVLSRSIPLRRRLYNTRSTSCPGQRIKVGEVILICLPRALGVWRLVSTYAYLQIFSPVFGVFERSVV